MEKCRRGDKSPAEGVDSLKIRPRVPAPVDPHFIAQRRTHDPCGTDRERLKVVLDEADRIGAGNRKTAQSAGAFGRRVIVAAEDGERGSKRAVETNARGVER